MNLVNETHDPALRCWVPGANQTGTDFPLQNLPFAVFRNAAGEAFRPGVAIGAHIIDLAALAASAPFTGLASVALASCRADSLNALMALGTDAWSALRLALSRALRDGAPAGGTAGDASTGATVRRALERALRPLSGALYAVPARIADYTDFYTSIHHATSVGRMFRPDNPLLPNYKWVPIGYHGRASSIGLSGAQVVRPCGQTLPPGSERPVMGPSRRMDYELELGIFVGPGNPLGEPVALDEADRRMFGMCLLNDWSARDLQAWEYQPLGPFLAKNFATTISPWIVSIEALAPFRTAFKRPSSDPQPLPYLDSAANREQGAFDIQLEVLIATAAMRKAGRPAHRLSLSSYHHAYWTAAQMFAHHTVNGCNLQPGDLLGTGTQSGPAPSEAGSLLELSMGGKQPVALPGGETRSFLEDGDTLVMRGWCEKPGAVRIGFGEVTGTIQPARA